jgi:hypothetical protein
MIYMAKNQDPRLKIVTSLMSDLRVGASWLAEKVDADPRSMQRWVSGEYSPRNRDLFEDLIKVLQNEKQSRGLSTIRDNMFPEIRRATLHAFKAPEDVGEGKFLRMIDIITPGFTGKVEAYEVNDRAMMPEFKPLDIVIVSPDVVAEPGMTVVITDGKTENLRILSVSERARKYVALRDGYPAYVGLDVKVKGVAVGRLREMGDGHTSMDFWKLGKAD